MVASVGAPVRAAADASAGAGHRHDPSVAAPDLAGAPIALGAEVKPTGSQTQEQAITSFEATIGRQLAYTRDYLMWDSPFPTSYENWLAARGTLPMISVKPSTMSGKVISWASIAAAQPGSSIYNQMLTWANEVKAFGYPVYFTFDHEPESAASSIYGTNPADFIAAWQNFHNVFVADGVTNATWIWIMTSYAFIVPPTDHRYAWNWYPGDAYVDALGADAYTAYTCDNPQGQWHSLAYQISGFVTFGAQHPTKPMWLPEFGVVEDPNTPGRKAQWISDAEQLFKGSAYDQFAGISYFNETRSGTACDWRISTSASAQAAFIALAQDPFYAASAEPTPDTTPPQVAITAPASGATESGTITLTASASDNVAVASVQFLVDGTPLSTSTTSPYTATLDTTTLTNGSHTIGAIATDTSGNTATATPVPITVANGTPPTTCAPTAPGMTELSNNLSLETNQNGWTGVYNANSVNTRVQPTGGSYDGSWALQLGIKSGATGAAGVNNANPFWVPGPPGLATSAGTQYLASAEVRAATAGMQATILVREVTPSGAGVSYASSTLTLNDTKWHALSTSYVARNTGDAIHYSLIGTFAGSSQHVLADCLSLQAS